MDQQVVPSLGSLCWTHYLDPSIGPICWTHLWFHQLDLLLGPAIGSTILDLYCGSILWIHKLDPLVELLLDLYSGSIRWIHKQVPFTGSIDWTQMLEPSYWSTTWIHEMDQKLDQPMSSTFWTTTGPNIWTHKWFQLLVQKLLLDIISGPTYWSRSCVDVDSGPG